ncbi:MAG: STAS domain-containing protein [Phycisphaerae bacterium]|nr:STAS domain-containing protein [Phycisphaerae bacterium]
MAELIDLGPLTLVRDGDHATITFAQPDATILEVPEHYEDELHAALDPLLADGVSFAVDLAGRRAISSRQLGLMLTLQKTVRKRQPLLTLRGVTTGVQRVLEITRTAQFFEFRD